MSNKKPNISYKSFEQLKEEIFPSLKKEEKRLRYERDSGRQGVVLANKAIDDIRRENEPT